MHTQQLIAPVICAGTLAVAGCSGPVGTSILANVAAPASLITVRDPALITSVDIAHMTSPAGAQKITEVPKSADSFVDSVGVNTHLYYSKSPYVTNYASVRQFLINLQARHLRDGLDQNSGQSYYNHLNDLATHGIHDDLVTHVGEAMSVITSSPALLPYAIESIEGPNEYDLSGNANWAADLRNFQRLLYTTVRNSPQLSSFPIVGPSFTSRPACMTIGNLSAMSSVGNMHDYFSFRNPGTRGWGSDFPPFGVYGSLPFNIGIVEHVYNPLPIISTETGWDDGATYGVTSDSVSAAVKARYTMRVLLEHFNAKVARTYLYELVDESGQNYGLLGGNLTVKPVYTALSALLDKLNDQGQAIVPTPLTYSMSADPTVHHTLLQKRDGSYRLMLWVEVPAEDPIVPKQSVTLSLPYIFGTIAQFAWQDNGTVTQTNLKQGAGNVLQLQVTDRVTELKLQR